MNKDTIINFLKDFYLFGELDIAQIESIASRIQVQIAPRGYSIVNQGEQAKGLYLVVQGQLKLGVMSLHGTEKVMRIASPSVSFGEEFLFGGQPSLFYAKATVDSLVLLIPKDVVFSLIASHTSLAGKMLERLSNEMCRMIQDIEMLTLQSCSERLFSYFQKIGIDEEVSGHIELPASKATIASLLNLTPETLSRTIFKLEQDGLIKVDGKTVTITKCATPYKTGMSLATWSTSTSKA